MVVVEVIICRYMSHVTCEPCGIDSFQSGRGLVHCVLKVIGSLSSEGDWFTAVWKGIGSLRSEGDWFTAVWKGIGSLRSEGDWFTAV